MNGVPASGASASAAGSSGRADRPTGKSIESESAPPSRKTETSTRFAAARLRLRRCPPRGREPERGAAVDGERHAGAAGDEAAAVRPVPAGSGMPGSIDGRPAAGLGDAAADELGAGEVVAAAAGHQQVWRSGETATSWRSGVLDERRVRRRPSSAFAPVGDGAARSASERLRVAGGSSGCPRTSSASSTIASGSSARAWPCRLRGGVRAERVVGDDTSGRGRWRCRASGRRPSRPRSAGGRGAGRRRSASQTHDVVSIAAADAAQQAGGVDDRRLHHARAEVEGRVAEDRLDDRADA